MRGIKRAVCVLFCLALLAGTLLPAAAMRFVDVASTSTMGYNISKLAEYGVISGFSDGSFQPFGTMTRAQFAKILFGLVNGSDDASAFVREGAFPDVPKDAWFSGYVGWGSARGLMGGTDDGNFHPDDPINYAQCIKMLAVADGASPKGAYPAEFEAYAKAAGFLNSAFYFDINESACRGIVAILGYNFLAKEGEHYPAGKLPVYPEFEGLPNLGELVGSQLKSCKRIGDDYVYSYKMNGGYADYSSLTIFRTVNDVMVEIRAEETAREDHSRSYRYKTGSVTVSESLSDFTVKITPDVKNGFLLPRYPEYSEVPDFGRIYRKHAEVETSDTLVLYHYPAYSIPNDMIVEYTEYLNECGFYRVDDITLSGRTYFCFTDGKIDVLIGFMSGKYELRFVIMML